MTKLDLKEWISTNEENCSCCTVLNTEDVFGMVGEITFVII